MSSSGMPNVVAKRLGYALKRAQHALRVSMDEAMRSLALTAPQYAVLSAVEAEPGLSNARLARAAFVTAQTMQGILANLERRGLLIRTPDPGNGRILCGSLTGRGREILAEAHDVVRIVEDRMVESLGRPQVERLATALSKCADDLRLDVQEPRT